MNVEIVDYQLENLFELLKANPDSLKVLDYELSFRTRNRAARLRSRIAEPMPAASLKPVNIESAAEITPPANHTATVVTLPRKPSHRTTSTQEPPEPSMDIGIPHRWILANRHQSQSLRMQTSQRPFSPHGLRWKRCLRKPIVALRTSWLETGAALPVCWLLASLGRSENAHDRSDSFIIR
jgi:hypothetical protein